MMRVIGSSGRDADERALARLDSRSNLALCADRAQEYVAICGYKILGYRVIDRIADAKQPAISFLARSF
jgi:hypothetical protein